MISLYVSKLNIIFMQCIYNNKIKIIKKVYITADNVSLDSYKSYYRI